MKKAFGAISFVMAIALALPAGAADLAPLQVFTDPVLDNPTLLEATPPAADLVAGYISETDATIDFTWEVVDLPDETGLPPLATMYYWEFTLTPPGGDPVPFSLNARYTPVEVTVAVRPDPGAAPVRTQSISNGRLSGNCQLVGTVTTCSPVEGAHIVVTSDGVANTITAKVRRTDLRDNNGVIVAVDDAELDEFDLFQGIAAYVSSVVGNLGAMSDLADMDDTYVLGSPRE